MRLALFRKAAIVVVAIVMSTPSILGQHSDAQLDKRLGEYAKMDQSQKVWAFSAETPATKASLFKRNLWAKANKLTLTQEQKKFLRSAYKKLVPEAFTEGTAENEELKATEAEARTLFTEKEIKSLFMVKELGVGVEDSVFFGEISYRPVRGEIPTYACYCIGSSDCPEGGYSCQLYMHDCTAGGSCGFWGLQVCRGGCKYNGGGELELYQTST